MKTMCKACLCLVLLWAVLSLSPMALAQTTAPQLPTAKELGFLIGKWDTTIVINPTEITPAGVKGTGLIEYRLFGQAIEGSQSSDSNVGHYEDRELIAYDSATDSYVMFTVNLNGMATQRNLKRYVDVWVLEYRGQISGKDFTIRGTYKTISKNELHYTAEVEVAGPALSPTPN